MSVLRQSQAAQKNITQQSEGLLWSGSWFSVNETVPSLESPQHEPAPNRGANTLTHFNKNTDNHNNKKTQLEQVSDLTDAENNDGLE